MTVSTEARAHARPGGSPRSTDVSAAVSADTGSATAEFAITLPVVVVLVAFVVASLGAISQSVRLADAAAVVARETARGDGSSVASSLERLAPGALVSTTRGPDLVCVDLRRDVHLGPLGGPVTLTSRSCAPAAGR